MGAPFWPSRPPPKCPCDKASVVDTNASSPSKASAHAKSMGSFMGNAAGAGARPRCAAGLFRTGCVAARAGVGRPRIGAREWYTDLTRWGAAARHLLARGGRGVSPMRGLKPMDIDAMPYLARLAEEVRGDGGGPHSPPQRRGCRRPLTNETGTQTTSDHFARRSALGHPADRRFWRAWRCGRKQA